MAATGTSAVKKASRDAAAASDVHALELTVWDMPSAIGAGERFKVYVGARCSAGCDLGDKALTLFDEHGAAACSVALGRAVWPGTEALYSAQVEVCAPLAVGNHPWEARMSGWEGESLHDAGVFPLVLNVVSAPDCEVTITVVDRESQAPIAGARVVMHPYRAVTDTNGVARLKVSKGQHDVLASAHRYLPSCNRIEVGADVITRVELDADQPDDEAYE